MLDLSTGIVEEVLGTHIDSARISKINRIITESARHSNKIPEAMILSDSRNLDDMGAIGIFNEFRRFVCTGKSICDVLQIWQRKIDYGYWQARLGEGFRFKTVHKIAEQRLRAAEYFMSRLKVETEAHDIEELLPNPTFV